MIRLVNVEDAPAITEIYNYYITYTSISFETRPLDVPEMRTRIQEIAVHHLYLVYEEDGEIMGYCYAHPWKDRAAYDHTMETTIYLNPRHKSKGIGTLLMKALIDRCRDNGYHALIACITKSNEPSCKFHAKLGFQKVSHFKEVGYKLGAWHDVVDYELLIFSHLRK